MTTRPRLLLLPALDVAGGRAVRPADVVNGAADQQRPSGEDPLEAALRLQAEGAPWLHLVDLDAAYGRGSNTHVLRGVVQALDIPVQVSGGIADDAGLEAAMSTGPARVNVSTGALRDLQWVVDVVRRLGERACIALDVRDGRLSPRGSGGDVGALVEVLDTLEAAGACRYVVTDVTTDGAMTGPNVELLRQVCRRTDRPVLASGGVATTAHLQELAALGDAGLEGVVLGTALSRGALTMADALAAVSS